MATCKCEYCEGKGTVKLNGGIFELDCPVCKEKGEYAVEDGMKICPQCNCKRQTVLKVSWDKDVGAVCKYKMREGKGAIPVESQSLNK